MPAREIATTVFGRNALTAGCICHAAALLAGMTTSSGADVFFKMIYPASWVLMTAGAYAEMRRRGGRPLNSWRFYAAATASVFPLLGPPLVLGLIYTFAQIGREGQGDLSGFMPALGRMRGNLLTVFALILLLFLFFAFIHSRHDPYFQKNRQHGKIQQLCGAGIV